MIVPNNFTRPPAPRRQVRVQRNAMTGKVRAAHKRREGAVGVSSREAASEGHPGAVLPNTVGGNGHPPLLGLECAGMPAKLGGTTECHGGFVLWDEAAMLFFSHTSQRRSFPP